MACGQSSIQRCSTEITLVVRRRQAYCGWRDAVKQSAALRLTFEGFVAAGDVADHLHYRSSRVEEWDAARLQLERAVRVQPDNAHAFLKLGIAQMHLGNLDGAGQALRRSMELDPRYADQANELLAGLARSG